jgi:hypothetical protein
MPLSFGSKSSIKPKAKIAENPTGNPKSNKVVSVQNRAHGNVREGGELVASSQNVRKPACTLFVRKSRVPRATESIKQSQLVTGAGKIV